MVERLEEYILEYEADALKVLNDDPKNLKEKNPRCFGCLIFECEEAELKLCDGCKIVSFCSEECRKKNSDKHEECCDYIKEIQLEIENIKKTNDISISKNVLTKKDFDRHDRCHGICQDNKKASKGDITDSFEKYAWKKQCLAFAVWHLAENANR